MHTGRLVRLIPSKFPINLAATVRTAAAHDSKASLGCRRDGAAGERLVLQLRERLARPLAPALDAGGPAAAHQVGEAVSGIKSTLG